MGNRGKALVEGVDTYRLILEIRNYLDMYQTLYVPTISHNLISLPKLDIAGFSCKFGSRSFSLFKYNSFINSGILYDDLYKLKLDSNFAETLLTMHHNIRIKWSLVDESSAYLWHKRLCHISKEMIERLVINDILNNLDFTDLGVYIDCIKGK